MGNNLKPKWPKNAPEELDEIRAVKILAIRPIWGWQLICKKRSVFLFLDEWVGLEMGWPKIEHDDKLREMQVTRRSELGVENG